MCQRNLVESSKKRSCPCLYILSTDFNLIKADLKTAAMEYRPTLERLMKNIKRGTEIYNTDIQVDARHMMELMRTIGESSAQQNNTEGMLAITDMWDDFASLRSSLSRYAQTRDPKDADRCRENLAGIAKAQARLEVSLASETGRKDSADLKKAYDEQTASFGRLEKVSIEIGKDLPALMASIASSSDKSNELNTIVEQNMRDLGVATRAANDSAITQTISVSAIGLVAGIIITLFIILGLIKVLTRMGGFASAIANGNFSYDPQIREKGEIGLMVQAMQQIPSTLNEVLAEYRTLENKVENGELQAKGNETLFKGEFATLIRGTNAVLGRFLGVIEHIPSPVVILDRTLKAMYINAVAREVAGENYEGKTCRELFQREDFGTDKDALKIAVEQRAPAHAETVAHPQAGAMDISYTAIPMLNAKGEIASVMQLITDVTEIKRQQNTIIRVANEASDISDRVAAASEEIASQVEQISRGAELQRSRVESTASAMTEMNSTVLEVAHNASQASEQSENTRHKAEEGSRLVEKVVSAINGVNSAALSLQENMHELGNQAESIGSVMGVISDIADQTNLLALNAAIEAARAGEAGRGFAVVADEVRKLAEKTMEATSEVGGSISAIQASARTNIEEMGNAVKSVSEATDLANSSGEALHEIVSLAAANSSIVASIATAAEEQSATSEEINTSIEEINKIVGETTDGMVQSAEAVQELSRMAQKLRSTMDSLK